MESGPSKSAEAIVAILVPPACREEVVGDLHERYRSPGQYVFDALITVPLVILSRVRRTADPQVVLIQAFVLYLSFLCAAWFKDAALLQAQWGLLRLAIPAGITLLVVMLEDAYASPGRRSPLSLVRGPVLGLAFALASQGLFWAGNPDLALPRWILLYGCAMSLLLSMRRADVISARDATASRCECARGLAKADRRVGRKLKTLSAQSPPRSCCYW